MVSVTFDPEAKAMYLDFDKVNVKVAKTLPLGGDLYLDIDGSGKAVGLEILFPQDLPQEAIDAIINAEKEIAVLKR